MKAKTMNPYVAPKVLIQKKSIYETATILLNELRTDLITMRSRSRKRELVSKRQAMIFLMRWYGFKFHELGRFFLHDHATMIHSVHAVENDMITNKELKEFIRRMQHTKLRKD